MTIPDIDLSRHAVLGSYATYAEAQHAVDALSDQAYPVAGVIIMGADLRLVEVVTGRLTTARAALAGAGAGAWFGLLVGVVISLGTPYLLAPLLWGLLWGAIFGALLGATGHLAWRGIRDFASTRRLVASRYDVLVRNDQLVRAQQLLGVAGGPPPTATAG
jgi:hypothetical protein